ncbi:MAG: hypothetical protein EOO40_05235 [Deltaproteobacteria bacterium]|nr:MAG: hypothetical protein EOO40_05235 [Deltaproteobacteria bacterium]
MQAKKQRSRKQRFGKWLSHTAKGGVGGAAVAAVFTMLTSRSEYDTENEKTWKHLAKATGLGAGAGMLYGGASHLW